MATTNLTLSDVFTPATQPQWLTALYSALSTLNLSSTAWQTGGVARTIVALMSQVLANEDGIISVAAQGGFLDFAASGTVTYTTSSGQTVTLPVTLDPSTLTVAQLASWLPGWLDILADGSYNVQRIAATYASNNIAITNATASAYGTFAAGTYHVANAATGATYSNTAALTIGAANIVGGTISTATASTPVAITTTGAHGLSTGQTVTTSGISGAVSGANGTFVVTVTSSTSFTLNGSVGTGMPGTGGTVNVCTVAPFAADVLGTSGSASVGAIAQPVTSLVNVTVTNTGAFAGQNYESNLQLAARCRLKLQSLSPNGPSGAYAYFAQSASTILGALTTPVALAGGSVTRALPVATAGIVTTYVANGSGAVAGAAGLAVTGAVSDGGLIKLTVNTAGIVTGNYVTVSGVGGVAAATGIWLATVIDGTHLDLQGSVFSGAYTSGGVLGWGDLGLVDSVIQANCVPAGTTAVTVSATPAAVTVGGTVYVPAAQVAAYTAALQLALVAYFGSLPIGGLATDGASNVVPYGAVEGVLYQAGILAGAIASYVRGITGFLLNGLASDVGLGVFNVATLGSTAGITIVGQ